eukprot:7937947-Pyramimonas_sp.AAC.1
MVPPARAPATHFGTPVARFVAAYGAPRPNKASRMRPHHQFQHTAHTFRGPIGSSTQSPT